METPSIAKIIIMGASLLLGAGALVIRARIPLPAGEDAAIAAAQKKRKRLFFAGILLLWLFSGLAFGLSGGATGSFWFRSAPYV